jgi:Virulence factor BrkB
LIISIAVAGFVFGREAAQNQIVETVGGMIGPESAQVIQGMIQYASNEPKTGTISTVLGAVALLFGAGGVVGQLTTALNKIWGGCAEIWPRFTQVYASTYGSGVIPAANAESSPAASDAKRDPGRHRSAPHRSQIEHDTFTLCFLFSFKSHMHS